MAAHDEILTIPEVAALVKIAERTVYVLAQRGDLPGFKLAGSGDSAARPSTRGLMFRVELLPRQTANGSGAGGEDDGDG